MRKITVVNCYAERLRQNHSGVSSQEEFDRHLSGILYETLISRENTTALVFFAYTYPIFMQRAIETMDDQCEDYNDAAIRIYRRILMGAFNNQIHFEDVFPKTVKRGWYAHWCNGYLATRPILHKDIPTLFVGGTRIVSQFQLMQLDEFGEVLPIDDGDFDLDGCLDLDDPSNYETDEDVSMDDEEIDVVMEEVSSYGFYCQDAVPMAAARISETKDGLYVSLLNECMPILETYQQRVIYVALRLSEVVNDTDVRDACVPVRWQSLVTALQVILGDTDETSKVMASFDAKVMFALYPLIHDSEDDVGYQFSILRCYVYNRVGVPTDMTYQIPTYWDYYAHYPISLLRYLSGEILLADLQSSLREEYCVKGACECVLLDENMLHFRNPELGFTVTESPLLPIIDKWSGLFPVIVRATPRNLVYKKLVMERDHPNFLYSTDPFDDVRTAVDLREKSDTNEALFGDALGRMNNYKRCVFQASVIIGFVFKAALACGSISWKLDSANTPIPERKSLAGRTNVVQMKKISHRNTEEASDSGSVDLESNKPILKGGGGAINPHYGSLTMPTSYVAWLTNQYVKFHDDRVAYTGSQGYVPTIGNIMKPDEALRRLASIVDEHGHKK